jgi:hypothetical protein
LLEVLDVKRETVKMDMVNGFIQIKQLMKENGLQQKRKARE